MKVIKRSGEEVEYNKEVGKIEEIEGQIGKKTGYTLVGWIKENKEEFVRSEKIKENIKLYTKYVEVKNGVIFDDEGRIETKEVQEGKTVEKIESKGKEGYTFKGWSKSSSAKLPSYYSKRSSGDISSATYYIVAGLLGHNNEILIENVGINPTRDGILHVCRAMGGNITLLNERNEGGEPVADILVKSSSLHGTVVEGDIIPTLIDEIPAIAVLAAFADGTTTIRDAAELKVKESDRIAVMVDNLSRMGVDIEGTDDGMIINGGRPVKGAVIDSHLDHRIAMSFAIGAMFADGDTVINDAECVDISYPTFYQDLEKLRQA